MMRKRFPKGDAPNLDCRSRGIQLLLGSRYVGRETYLSAEARYACSTSLFDLRSAFS